MAYFEEKDRRIASLEAQLRHWQTLQRLSQREIESLKRSWSYRVGRTLLFPLSRLKVRRDAAPAVKRSASAARHALARLPRQPAISIVMPVRDPRPDHLAQALESVERQTYDAWTLSVVDDGSSDRAVLRHLEEFRRRHPERVRLSRFDAGRGIAAASNAAARTADGEFLGFLDHDDTLADDALLRMAERIVAHDDVDLLYSDEDKLDRRGRRVEPFHKPGFSPALLECNNYICHFLLIRRALFERLGGFDAGVDGSQDFDLVLRAVERARRIEHVPEILYHWRMAPGSAAGDASAKGGPWRESSREALRRAVARRGSAARVEDGIVPGTYRLRRAVDPATRVTVIVPTRDRLGLLRRCVDGLSRHDTGAAVDLLVVSNGSRDEATYRYLRRGHAGGRMRFLLDDGPFSFSRLCNRGAAASRAEFLLFLNNDVEPLHDGWLAAMLEPLQDPEVGAVGPKLLYPDGRVQHAGIVLGLMGVAGHVHRGLAAADHGPHGLADTLRDCSAVTGACMLTRRTTFERLGGFDERLAVAFNDVDYGLRLADAGERCVYTPYARLRHDESASRGSDHRGARASRFQSEILTMVDRWGERLDTDPFYNPNLTCWREDRGLPAPDDARRRTAFHARFAAEPPSRRDPSAAQSRTEYAAVWDALAADADSARTSVTGESDERALAASAAETARALEETVGVRADDEVLEIGCGIGRVGSVVAPRCARWLGCDVSANMLRHARKRLAGLDNVELLPVSGFDLGPIEDETVDLAYCTVVFMHLEEWERYRYVREAYRALRPGGRVFVDNLALDTDQGWDVFQAHGRIPPDRRPAHISRPSTGQELAAYARRSGFEQVQWRPRGPFVQCWGVK